MSCAQTNPDAVVKRIPNVPASVRIEVKAYSGTAADSRRLLATSFSRGQRRNCCASGPMSFECERLNKLLEDVGGDRKVHSHITMRTSFRVIVGSKDVVPHDRHFTEVGIGLSLVSAVMPTVKLRCVDEVVEHAAPHFDIRVSKDVAKPT